MRRKALVGILVCLMLGTIMVSVGGEKNDLSIEIPDELPSGQKLVNTQGAYAGDFPHCTGCKVYIYEPFLCSHCREIKPRITIYSFQSKTDAKNGLRNLGGEVNSVSEFIRIMRSYNPNDQSLQSLFQAYSDCKIPDLYVLGDGDAVLFPLDNYIVGVRVEEYLQEQLYQLEIAELVYSLNDVGAPKPTPAPSEELLIENALRAWYNAKETIEKAGVVIAELKNTGVDVANAQMYLKLANEHLNNSLGFYNMGRAEEALEGAQRASAHAEEAKKLAEAKAEAVLGPTLSPRPTITSAPTPSEKTESPREEDKGTPGFEAVFAIAVLLAIAYILRRR